MLSVLLGVVLRDQMMGGTMGLKDLLDSGRMVVGSEYDGKVKPLGEMSQAAQQRNGYADRNGNWTDRGYDRATSEDYEDLEKSRQARKESK